MIIRLDIFRLDEPVLGVFPIEFDLFGALFKLPCKWMDRPSRVQAFICEAEGFAFSEESDVGI
jgi:hypothetical protein